MSANYWEQIPALTPLQFYKPYQPAYEEKLKTIQAQTAYWQEGARQVNSVLDRANQLNLITENKDRAQNFEKEADDKIVALSKNNLAVNGVASQAMNVYAPLFNDVDIRGEDSLLNINKDILSKNEAEKTKDGGKNYNPALDKLIRANLNNIKEYNKKDAWRIPKDVEYQPYYDKQKEQLEFRKNNIQDVTKDDYITAIGGLDNLGKAIGVDPANGFIKTTISNADIDYLKLYNQWQAYKSDKYKAQEQLESDADFAVDFSALNGKDLASKYTDKLTYAYETTKNYLDQEKAQDSMKISRFENESDKTAINTKIALIDKNLEELKNSYTEKLSNVSQMIDGKNNLFNLGDLSAFKKLNYIANTIDDEYNNVKFAVSNSAKNNSTTITSAPEGYNAIQRGVIADNHEMLKAKLKIQEEASKVKTQAEKDALGLGENEHVTLFPGQTFMPDGVTLTPEAIAFNQATGMGVSTTNYVASEVNVNSLETTALYNEQKRNIQDQINYPSDIRKSITRGLFSDSKGVVTQLTSNALKPEDMENQDIEAIKEKTASMAYLFSKQLDPNTTKTLEEFKNGYKNFNADQIIRQYNAQLEAIITPDENGHVDKNRLSILSQGLTDDKQRDLSELLAKQEANYLDITVKNLQLTTDAIYNADRNFFNYLKDNGQLTESGRLKKDNVEENLKNYINLKTLSSNNYIKFDNNIKTYKPSEEVPYGGVKAGVEFNKTNSNILKAIKQKYLDVYRAPMENVQKTVYYLETRNDNNAKGSEDDVNKDNKPMQKAASTLLSKTGKMFYKTEEGNLINVSEGGSDVVKGNGKPGTGLSSILKNSVQNMDGMIDKIIILNDVLDKDGPNNSNAKELTVSFGFNNSLLSKPNPLRDRLEAAGYLNVNDTGVYTFKPEVKNIFVEGGIQVKIGMDDALAMGLNEDFLQKKTQATAAILQTKKGGGFPITLFGDNGKPYNIRIKNTNTENDPEFIIIDEDGGLATLGEKYTPSAIMQGLMIDLKTKGIDINSKTIGDNMGQRVINMWYGRKKELKEERERNKNK
jgi:hypothetical protein